MACFHGLFPLLTYIHGEYQADRKGNMIDPEQMWNRNWHSFTCAVPLWEEVAQDCIQQARKCNLNDKLPDLKQRVFDSAGVGYRLVVCTVHAWCMYMRDEMLWCYCHGTHIVQSRVTDNSLECSYEGWHVVSYTAYHPLMLPNWSGKNPSECQYWHEGLK